MIKRGWRFLGHFADVRIDNKINVNIKQQPHPDRRAPLIALCLTDNTQLAAPIQAEQRFREPKPPASSRLWAKAIKYILDCMNPTATGNNPEPVSPNERYYGTPEHLLLRPFLQRSYSLRKRFRKGLTEGSLCVDLGPAPLNSCDTLRVHRP